MKKVGNCLKDLLKLPTASEYDGEHVVIFTGDDECNRYSFLDLNNLVILSKTEQSYSCDVWNFKVGNGYVFDAKQTKVVKQATRNEVLKLLSKVFNEPKNDFESSVK